MAEQQPGAYNIRMATSSSNTSIEHDRIAQRAFEIWTNRGNPTGLDLEIWLEAERSLQRSTQEFERNGSVGREAHANPPGHATPGLTASGHFVVLVDRGHLRIYSVDRPVGIREMRYTIADALDFPDGKNSYTSNDSDQAGRFPGSRGLQGGLGIDERLPMQRERDSKLAEQIAERISRFLEKNPSAIWDYAAGPAIHKAVLDRVSAPARRRLRTVLTKDLVNIPANELRAHFGSNGRS